MFFCYFNVLMIKTIFLKKFIILIYLQTKIILKKILITLLNKQNTEVPFRISLVMTIFNIYSFFWGSL
jgi:hypothetical protein